MMDKMTSEALETNITKFLITKEDLVNRFGAVDYVVFSIMLLVSAGIGVFYGCFGKKMKNTKEFLLAGKSMTTFPVAMSLIASFMSAIALLGTPSEVYKNGITYWLIGFSYVLVMPAAAYLYLPVFWKLQVTSAYEYLEIRFSKPVRILGSLIFIIQMTLYMAIVVYAPALALAQVTGINVYLSVCVISFVCIFYTTIGGMKAVLWTDVVQVVIMYTAIISIVVYGTFQQGGFAHVWEVSTRGQRTRLIDWDVNPTTRHTFWTLVIGGFFTWITIYGVNQAQVQRYLCVKEKHMAIRALYINVAGLFLLMITCAFGGLVIYTKYEKCDPFMSGLVTKDDQLLPFYVMETIGEFKGIPGLFVAGIFSGALRYRTKDHLSPFCFTEATFYYSFRWRNESTVSSGMNSLAAITLEDFFKGGCTPNISEKKATLLSKGLSLFYGLLTFGLVFVAERLGDILSAALGIFGMIGGPLCGVFTLGMFFPWANSVGAFCGTVFGLLFTLAIGVGFQVLKYANVISATKLPVNTDDCIGNLTIQTTVAKNISWLEGLDENSPMLQIFQVSYLWYSAIGMFSVIIVGMLISLLTGLNDVSKINPDTITPLILWIKDYLPGCKSLGISDINDHEKLKCPQRNGSLMTGVTDTAVDEQIPQGRNEQIEMYEHSSKF